MVVCFWLQWKGNHGWTISQAINAWKKSELANWSYIPEYFSENKSITLYLPWLMFDQNGAECRQGRVHEDCQVYLWRQQPSIYTQCHRNVSFAYLVLGCREEWRVFSSVRSCLVELVYKHILQEKGQLTNRLFHT